VARLDEARLERVLADLRAQGSRVTTARRAVLRSLLERREHTTAEQLAEQVRARHPDVHLSTVYRTLDALQHLGIVTHVHLGHGRAVYHLTDEIHHHAVCERCGAVIELPPELFGSVSDRLRRDFGFAVDTHHFALVGRCRSCGSPAGNGPGP